MGNLKLGDWAVEVPGIPGYSPNIGDTGVSEILGTSYQTVIGPDGKEWLSENLLWTSRGTWWLSAGADDGDGRYYNSADADVLSATLVDGWRIPTYNDVLALFASLASPAGPYPDIVVPTHWRTPNVANNATGLAITPTGRYDAFYPAWQDPKWFPGIEYPYAEFIQAVRPGYGSGWTVWGVNQDNTNAFAGAPGTYPSNTANRHPVRLVRDVVPVPPTPPAHISGTHDLLVLPSGQAETTESLAQRIDVRLRTFLGEHWLNPELGIPWFRDFLTKAPDLAVCRQVLWDTILGVRGVRTINRLDLAINKATRVLTVTFAVNGTDSFTSTITV